MPLSFENRTFKDIFRFITCSVFAAQKKSLMLSGFSYDMFWFFFVLLAPVLTRPGEKSNSSFKTMADFHGNLHPRVLERERTLGTRLFPSLFLSYFLIKLLICPGAGGQGVLPYMGYIGVCRCEGYGFQAVYSRIGYINHSVWV